VGRSELGDVISCEILQLEVNPELDSFSIERLYSVIIIPEVQDFVGGQDTDFAIVGHKALITMESEEHGDALRILVWDFKNNLLSSELLIHGALQVHLTICHTISEARTLNCTIIARHLQMPIATTCSTSTP